MGRGILTGGRAVDQWQQLPRCCPTKSQGRRATQSHGMVNMCELVGLESCILGDGARPSARSAGSGTTLTS